MCTISVSNFHYNFNLYPHVQFINGLFTPPTWTRQNCLVLSPIVFTPPTTQFCFVSTQFRWVLSRLDPGSNLQLIACSHRRHGRMKQNCLVSSAVVFTPPTRTRQSCFALSMSAVWTSHNAHRSTLVIIPCCSVCRSTDTASTLWTEKTHQNGYFHVTGHFVVDLCWLVDLDLCPFNLKVAIRLRPTCIIRNIIT